MSISFKFGVKSKKRLNNRNLNPQKMSNVNHVNQFDF